MAYIRSIIILAFNTCLKTIGYVRVYDIQNGVDLTLIYYFLKIKNIVSQKIRIPSIGVNEFYPMIGVCRYVGSRYTRYICHNMKIQDIDRISVSLSFSAKKYHDIKKIEIITKHKNTDDIILVLDVTNAKINFFDTNYSAEIPMRDNDNETPIRITQMVDIIKFYQTMNYEAKINTNSDENRTIRVTLEKFDDDSLEFTTSCEEFQLK
jgi:hypothetical protein